MNNSSLSSVICCEAALTHLSGWTCIRGGLKHVSASGHGYIRGTNNGDQIFKYKKPCKGAWIRVGGFRRQIYSQLTKIRIWSE